MIKFVLILLLFGISTRGEAIEPAWRDSADILRDANPEPNDFLQDPIFTAVTTEFGPTVISVQPFPFRSELATATQKPWSSWWFPKAEKFLFDDSGPTGQSTLTKYDKVKRMRYLLTGSIGPAPASAALYEANHFDPHALVWEGLCDAWALASISSLEPKKSVTLGTEGGGSVTFTVGDLKALLLKTYEAVDDTDLHYYGQKFRGDDLGWIYPDIFPEQFHRFLEIQLFQKRLPFIMDHDPGVEVWNVPVYKANYTLDNVPGEPDSVAVRAWLFSASSTQEDQKDFVGTQEVVREFNYILKGKRNPNGELVINSGYWTKGPSGVDSRKDHPDYLVKIPESKPLVRRSNNPEIDIKLVDKILSYSY